MHVAFVTDIHANLHALKAVLKDIAKAGADTLVNLGDVVGYGANPKECVDLLRRLGTKGVIGNHDFYVTTPAVETILRAPTRIPCGQASVTPKSNSNAPFSPATPFSRPPIRPPPRRPQRPPSKSKFLQINIGMTRFSFDLFNLRGYVERTMKVGLLAISACLVLLSASASAALLAHYDFTDGNLLDNEVGATYTLAEVAPGTGNVTINGDGSAHFPGNDGANSAYLQVEGPGGSPDWTVSFWWRSDSMDQGNYQGLFAAGITSTENYSWQVDNSGADMRLVSRGTAVNPTLSFPDNTLTTDTWYHTVVRKSGGSNAAFYTTALGAATVDLKGSQANNPGGLLDFRLGTNRAVDSLFRFDMANVKIYNDSSEDLDTLLAEGPQLVPEPATFSLLALGLAAALLRRRA